MLYVRANGKDVTSDIEAGSLSLTLNYLPEEPDSGSFTLYNNEGEPLRDVQLTFKNLDSDRVSSLILLSDTVTELPRSSERRYRHDVILVDQAIGLSKISCSALSFLRSGLNLYEALARVFRFAGDFLYQDYGYELRPLSRHDSATIKVLRETVCPELALGQASLLDQLNSLANPFGLAVRVLEGKEISFELVRPITGTDFKSDTICEKRQTLSFDTTYDKKVVFVNRGIDSLYLATAAPGFDQITSPRSEDTTLSDDNLTFNTPFPAWRICGLYTGVRGNTVGVSGASLLSSYTNASGQVLPTPFVLAANLDITTSLVTANQFATLPYANKQTHYYYNLHATSHPLTATRKDDPFFTTNKLAKIQEAAARNYLTSLTNFVGEGSETMYSEARFSYPTGKNALLNILYTPEISGRFVTGLGTLEQTETASELSNLPILGSRKLLEVAKFNQPSFTLNRRYPRDVEPVVLGATESGYSLIRQQLTLTATREVLAVEEYQKNLNEFLKFTNVETKFTGVYAPDEMVDRAVNYSIRSPSLYSAIAYELSHLESVGGNYVNLIYATVTDSAGKKVRLPTAVSRFGNSLAFTFQMDNAVSFGDRITTEGSLQFREPVVLDYSNALTVGLHMQCPEALVYKILTTGETYAEAYLGEAVRSPRIIRVFREIPSARTATVVIDGREHLLAPGYYRSAYPVKSKASLAEADTVCFQYIGQSLWNIALADGLIGSASLENDQPEAAKMAPLDPGEGYIPTETLLTFTRDYEKDAAERLTFTVQVFNQ